MNLLARWLVVVLAVIAAAVAPMRPSAALAASAAAIDRDVGAALTSLLVDDDLSAEADRTKVRRAHLEAIATALPGRKVARFYQKMDAVLRYDLAAEIPVVGE